jgi:hypothetical protein
MRSLSLSKRLSTLWNKKLVFFCQITGLGPSTPKTFAKNRGGFVIWQPFIGERMILLPFFSPEQPFEALFLQMKYGDIERGMMRKDQIALDDNASPLKVNHPNHRRGASAIRNEAKRSVRIFNCMAFDCNGFVIRWDYIFWC